MTIINQLIMNADLSFKTEFSKLEGKHSKLLTPMPNNSFSSKYFYNGNNNNNNNFI